MSWGKVEVRKSISRPLQKSRQKRMVDKSKGHEQRYGKSAGNVAALLIQPPDLPLSWIY